MRIEATDIFAEVRKIQIKETEKSKRLDEKDVVGEKENSVALENSRALNLALNNKEFAVNLEKVARLKEEIENGNYQPDAEKIAKRLILSEKRGDFYLGITKT